jgi:hypothetical protein
MGVMRFTVNPEGLLDAEVDLPRAYISGFDGRVFASRFEIDGDNVDFRRVNSDSGKLQIPYPVAGFGKPIVSTASLREHEDPYILSLELARGKICQVRNQLATWEGLGMQIPEEFRAVHKESHHLFAQATAAKPDIAEVTRLADLAIAKSFEAIDQLANAYVRQRLSVRFKRSPQLPVSFGCSINSVTAPYNQRESFLETFNAAAIPIEWKQIEPQEGEYNWDFSDELVAWCMENRLLMRGGPLLDLSAAGLPDWLNQWGHDFFNLQSFVCDFVETAISRYAGKVRLWEVSSRVNTGGSFNLSEEERLTLVARTLEVARQSDEEGQLIIRIEDPWGSYLSAGEHRLSPIQFVDALLRCGVGLSGINLEITVGYATKASAPRDLLDLSRLIDQWSMLEVPLNVTLAFPSCSDPDPQASEDMAVAENSGRSPWSTQAQSDWIDSVFPLLMAKQSVVGIYWSHLTDASRHVFPNSGLVDAAGVPKSSFQSILDQRTGKWLN